MSLSGGRGGTSLTRPARYYLEIKTDNILGYVYFFVLACYQSPGNHLASSPLLSRYWTTYLNSEPRRLQTTTRFTECFLEGIGIICWLPTHIHFFFHLKTVLLGVAKRLHYLNLYDILWAFQPNKTTTCWSNTFWVRHLLRTLAMNFSLLD